MELDGASCFSLVELVGKPLEAQEATGAHGELQEHMGDHVSPWERGPTNAVSCGSFTQEATGAHGRLREATGGRSRDATRGYDISVYLYLYT